MTIEEFELNEANIDAVAKDMEHRGPPAREHRVSQRLVMRLYSGNAKSCSTVIGWQLLERAANMYSFFADGATGIVGVFHLSLSVPVQPAAVERPTVPRPGSGTHFQRPWQSFCSTESPRTAVEHSIELKGLALMRSGAQFRSASQTTHTRIAKTAHKSAKTQKVQKRKAHT